MNTERFVLDWIIQNAPKAKLVTDRALGGTLIDIDFGYGQKVVGVFGNGPRELERLENRLMGALIGVGSVVLGG